MTLQALPVRVPLVARETLESYLSRLGTANHLEPRDLRVHLGMRSPTRPPDLDRLSTLTGNSARRLTGMLADAVPPPGRTRAARRGAAAPPADTAPAAVASPPMSGASRSISASACGIADGSAA